MTKRLLALMLAAATSASAQDIHTYRPFGPLRAQAETQQ